MSVIATSLLKRSLDNPDDLRTLDKTRIEVVSLSGHTVMRTIFEPGWKWSECVKPAAKTADCEAAHFAVCLSGRLRIKARDGAEIEVKPGDVASIAPGHDAWVVGNEPFVCLDFLAGESYGR